MLQSCLFLLRHALCLFLLKHALCFYNQHY
uniref:Uncharacterized protein n=1 Tax=Rhizophora mucronata TaxID=61149 RepID=A0A2P2PTC0_RHIMU